jgi:sensor histidine kinase YesM
MKEEKLANLFADKGGIGVTNVNERLRVIFGRRYRITVDSKLGQGTKTLIEIPELETSTATVAVTTVAER